MATEEKENTMERHPDYDIDMEAREFDAVGDLNGSQVTLWQGPRGWSTTVQYRSAHTGYTNSSIVPLRRNASEEEAREAFRVTIQERDGWYAAEATRLGL